MDASRARTSTSEVATSLTPLHSSLSSLAHAVVIRIDLLDIVKVSAPVLLAPWLPPWAMRMIHLVLWLGPTVNFSLWEVIYSSRVR